MTFLPNLRVYCRNTRSLLCKDIFYTFHHFYRSQFPPHERVSANGVWEVATSLPFRKHSPPLPLIQLGNTLQLQLPVWTFKVKPRMANVALPFDTVNSVVIVAVSWNDSIFCSEMKNKFYIYLGWRITPLCADVCIYMDKLELWAVYLCEKERCHGSKWMPWQWSDIVEEISDRKPLRYFKNSSIWDEWKLEKVDRSQKPSQCQFNLSDCIKNTQKSDSKRL